MSKHTPGPWELDGVEIRATAAHPSESLCVMTPGFEKADAELMAAAPTLRDHLEAVIQVAESEIQNTESDRYLGRSVEQLYAAKEMPQELVEARAFLEQLKGEQPKKCCEPTADEEVLLATGEYTPEELWGGRRPTCPKCIGDEQP